MDVARALARLGFIGGFFLISSAPAPARASEDVDSATGYLVWSRGEEYQPETRKLVRMTFSGGAVKEPALTLTEGEDVEAQISPDGKYVAYAKAKIPGADYHSFSFWKVYVVSIHGKDVSGELKVDDSGYWPNWLDNRTLSYCQMDPAHPNHSVLMKAKLDEDGVVLHKEVVLRTYDLFPSVAEVNECVLSPDGRWFAARTRAADAVSDRNGVGAFTLDPPNFQILARAGSVGCMPQIARSGTWAVIAGRDRGIRWGDSPFVSGGLVDQPLTPASRVDPGSYWYFPSLSSDEKWLLSAVSTVDDHNAGPQKLMIAPLTGRTAGEHSELFQAPFNGWPSLWIGTPTAPPPPRPKVQSFKPDTYTLVAGQSVTLTWQTAAADRVTLNDVAVAAAGTQTFQPPATTTYALAASNSQSGSTTARSELTVTVNAQPEPVAIRSFQASLDRITLGGSLVLSWDVQNPFSIELDGEPVGPSGSKEVSPTASQSYVLTATGASGPVSSSVSVQVEPLVDARLLPDRGGCRCGSAAGPWDAAWGLVAGVIWALRISRKPEGRGRR